ncbi:MAG TPA: hypothetical protein VGW98_11580 [Solirubrobacteraceae bacterium]|jgi:hypothetical protein|nr:hypothetical protein [Solirubrobacteraceae bacterium]
MNVAEFAEKVLRQPLWPHQVQLADSDAFISCVAAARRSGKSETVEVLGMHTAFSNANCRVLVLSAGQDSARRLTESIAQRLNANELTRGAVVDDFSTRIRLSNGSEIISLPASQRQIRGYGKNLLLLAIDEAGFVPEELWAAARFTALDEKANGSRILLLGSPWGKGFFRREFDLGMEGDPDHKSFSWAASANPTLDHDYLAREKSRVSAREFASEVEGKWSDAVGSLFSRELLESCTADIVVPRYQDLRGPALGVLGCDWGVSFDRSAVAAIFRLPVAALNVDAEPMARFVAFTYGWPAGEQLHKVVKGIVANIAPFSHVVPETNGVGAMPSSELRRLASQSRAQRNDWAKRRWEFVNTSATSKTVGYSLVLGMMERGQLVIPRDPDLLRQLAGLKFEQGERGFTRIESEDIATHDDLSDALMLATIPYKPPRAHRVVCHLAMLANSNRAPADAKVPPLACPTVQTGGGLKVPQVPTLQSVASGEYTTYAPVEPAQAEGFTTEHFRVTTTKQGVM